MEMSPFWSSITAIALAIVGLATVAVIVSRNANTSQVIQSSGQSFATSIMAATAPVTGNNPSFGFSGGLTGMGTPLL